MYSSNLWFIALQILKEEYVSIRHVYFIVCSTGLTYNVAFPLLPLDRDLALVEQFSFFSSPYLLKRDTSESTCTLGSAKTSATIARTLASMSWSSTRRYGTWNP